MLRSRRSHPPPARNTTIKTSTPMRKGTYAGTPLGRLKLQAAVLGLGISQNMGPVEKMHFEVLLIVLLTRQEQLFQPMGRFLTWDLAPE